MKASIWAIICIVMYCCIFQNEAAPPLTKFIGCSHDEVGSCRCCKMECWHSIANAAIHSLGHIPGQAGEDEALATLKLIRICMITNCGDECSLGGRQRFYPN
uniref:Saposin B-type domain-containing protein n=1 Tax=Rhabditophanes sp. KR3021 TaxID=114890 RepID=A0AC35TTA1_9BILA